MIPYRVASLVIGIAFIFLAIYWRDDPAACAILIFFAGTLFVLGSRMTFVNQEDEVNKEHPQP